MTYFIVITGVPDAADGNYATSGAHINPNAKEHFVGSNIIISPPKFDEELFGKAVMSENKVIDLSIEQLVFCCTPVFKLGEILIMDSNDRVIPDDRKPSKWNVEYESFNNIKSAIKRAKEVVGYDRTMQ